jgi:hypothetical protein
MAVIFNQKKQKFNPANGDDKPTYVFDGTWEEFEKLKRNGLAILGKNVFLIDKRIIVK